MDKQIKSQLNHIQFYSQMRSIEVLPRLLLILCIIGGAHSADNSQSAVQARNLQSWLNTWANSPYPSMLMFTITFIIIIYIAYVVFYGNNAKFQNVECLKTYIFSQQHLLQT
jgi:hypothetical protein